ncbi:hypothetical protein [Xylocopilactobacillus apicola]|uniref:Uncharacterized protein n=1 Tax=Xylocopilactobacillus apicola TaxID=2932184 RepID=A0AAU9DCU1_9LACO|nr:hypothetical protein [Xylocopilactobacillus apicola]BDR59380.1 hypothetical protein XA3_18210 [Xylocopilactobacillus apicola]
MDEEEISKQVSSLIWDLSAYMTNEICPNCLDSNLRLTLEAGKERPIIKFCDECLYTGVNDKYTKISGDLVPATKKIVESYLKFKLRLQRR